jgi:hypothetical protein
MEFLIHDIIRGTLKFKDESKTLVFSSGSPPMEFLIHDIIRGTLKFSDECTLVCLLYFTSH